MQETFHRVPPYEDEQGNTTSQTLWLINHILSIEDKKQTCQGVVKLSQTKQLASQA